MGNSSAKFWYSFGNLPFFVLPVVAYLGSSRRGSTPVLTWAAGLLRGGGWAVREPGTDEPTLARSSRSSCCPGPPASSTRSSGRASSCSSSATRPRPSRRSSPGSSAGWRSAARSAVGWPTASGRPLRLYGLIELVLVVVVIATPLTFRVVRTIYGDVALGLEGSPQLLALVRLGLAVLALAPATILMGATLPTLTRYLSTDAHLSQSFGRLYAANTIGAIVGTLAGRLRPHRAAWPVRRARGRRRMLGGRRGGGAGLARRPASSRTGRTGRRAIAAPARPNRRSPMPAPDPSLALTVAFISGLTSLGYQVAVDPAPGLGDRQHHVRLHDHPRGLPGRPGGRRAPVQPPPPADRRPDPAARDRPDPRRGARHGGPGRGRRSGPSPDVPGGSIETLQALLGSAVARRPARDRRARARASRHPQRCWRTTRDTPAANRARSSRSTPSARSRAALSSRSS